MIIDGFCSFAPEFAHSGSGFKSTFFSELIRLEEANFWFRSRNQLILWAFEKYCPRFRSFLEIGCGTGYVLSGVAKAFPQAAVYGSEIFTAGLDFAANRLPSVNFMQMDARNIPFEEEFDVVGAFDVLEHIEEDELVLSQIQKALKPGSILLLTVPQHAWLWSPVDDYACHKRRYCARDLHSKLHAAGFEILRSTSFVSSLLPAMWLSRLIQKRSQNKIDGSAEFRISNWLNHLLGMFLAVEIRMIASGFNFSFGGSRLVVARKL
jgi:SAM-dependent methyltransferase